VTYSTGYLKVVGVVAVILCFIYFKYSKKDEVEITKPLGVPKRQGEGSKAKLPPEIEELLKKKGK
jgi:hypothetical protein